MGVEPFLLAPIAAPACSRSAWCASSARDCARPDARDRRRPRPARRRDRRRRAAPPRARLPGLPGLGYRGRTGIYEVVTVDREMEALIHRGAAEAELVAHARRLGPSLIEDGVRKIGQGVTTVEEVARVARSADRWAPSPIRAVDRVGSAASGVLEAASAAAARQDLRARGLLPVEVAASGREVQPERAGESRAFARLCCRHRRARPHAAHPPARDADRQRRPDRGRAPHRRAAEPAPGRLHPAQRPRRRARGPQLRPGAGRLSGGLLGILPRLGHRRRAVGPARPGDAPPRRPSSRAARATPSRCSSRCSTRASSRARVARHHHHADDLRDARHHPGLHLPRRRPAAADPRPDRAQRGGARLRPRRAGVVLGARAPRLPPLAAAPANRPASTGCWPRAG